MKILHYSEFNTVNVPLTYCQLYQKFGHESRLLTRFKHRGGIPEDICLQEKIFDPWWLRNIRKKRQVTGERLIAEAAREGHQFEFKPSGILEKFIFPVRDFFREIRFNKVIKANDLNSFDIYCFHGGADYFRDCRWVKQLKKRGKVILCHYHGPDIRTRGIVKDVDDRSVLNLTNEFDLLDLHPNLRYIPIPFDNSHLPSSPRPHDTLRIIHTPSNPAAKGTHLIEPILKQLASERRIEYRILTGVSHQKIMQEKEFADIAIDQVGNFGGTGYGVNSIETLAMNIATITEFTPEYEKFLQPHPFVLATPKTLHPVLLDLIDNPQSLAKASSRGRPWVESHHGFENVWKTLWGYLGEVYPEIGNQR